MLLHARHSLRISKVMISPRGHSERQHFNPWLLYFELTQCMEIAQQRPASCHSTSIWNVIFLLQIRTFAVNNIPIESFPNGLWYAHFDENELLFFRSIVLGYFGFMLYSYDTDIVCDRHSPRDSFFHFIKWKSFDFSCIESYFWNEAKYNTTKSVRSKIQINKIISSPTFCQSSAELFVCLKSIDDF